MKLGIFIQHYFPYGGLQRDALRLAEAAYADNDEPILIVSKWDGPRPNTLKVLELNSRGKSNHKKAKFFAADCQKIYQQEGLDTAISFSRVPNTPFHFCGDPCYKERFTRTKPNWLSLTPRYKYLLKTEESLFGNQSNTHIFYLAASEIPAYQQFYPLPKNRFTLLPPWTKPPQTSPLTKKELKSKLLTSLNLPQNKEVLLFVGSDFKRKGLDLAIRALEKTNNSNTIIIACGKDNPSKPLKLAQELNINDRVHILGPRDDIPEWMLAADLLIHPARQETAGMVLTEALTYNLPVICTACCGYAEHIKKAGSTVIPNNHSIEELSTAIQNTLKNRIAISSQTKQWNDNQAKQPNTASIILNKIRSSTTHNECLD